ncbi:MAG: hypothetical protein ACWGMZ_04260 [Thermoguttaceae bacterium]
MDQDQTADKASVPKQSASAQAGVRSQAKEAPEKTLNPSLLAPGVMITIDADRDLRDTVNQHDVLGLLAEDKNLDWAKKVAFRRTIWALQFSFKPVRMIWVDVPQPSGMMQRKLIWYMVYSVTNTGQALVPVAGELPYENNLADKKKIYEIKSVDKPIHFVPEFLLEGHNRLEKGKGFTKVYPDRIIPVAVGPIQSREGYNQTILTSVEMNREIAAGQTFWGVATWEDLDPKIIKFSVLVGGLTNAYKWKDMPVAHKPGEPIGTGERLLRKTLKLNFWRPGDEYFLHEEEIRYGLPGGLDYQWIYR